MIPRYTREEMGHIWSERNEFDTMLLVETLASEAQAELGVIPKEAAKAIREKGNFDVERIHEIEKETNHDIISFVTAVGEYVGPEAAKYIHLGLTSTDVKDTALGYMMKQACDILIEDLKRLHEVLRRRAAEFKYTPMIGRTHGIHGEPTTFGLKLALWMAEVERDIERMEHARKSVAVGKLSGAVGTYSNIDPFVEQYVCEKLGLEPVKIATQVVQRDRHAELLSTIAVVGGTLDKIALEIRHLQRTEVREAEEFFRKGQKGSSAMPHKRNPIGSENMAGCARVLRGYMVTAYENVALWHERDISHSSAERIIAPDTTILIDYMLNRFGNIVKNLTVFPDATMLLDYMLNRFTNIIDNLTVYEENMLENINKTHGVIFSQRVMLKLIEKGFAREKAYDLVQPKAMQAWEERQSFRTLLEADETVCQYLDAADLDDCFDHTYHLKSVDGIFERLGL